MQEEQPKTEDRKFYQIIYTMTNGERIVGVEGAVDFKTMESQIQTWLENDRLHVFSEPDRALVLVPSHVVSYAIRELESQAVAETIRNMALGNVQPPQEPQPNRAERRKAKKGKK